MNKYDQEMLKSLLEKKVFERARMNITGEHQEFESLEELLVWLRSNHPGEGSFILLQGGAWVEWQCIAIGYEYCHMWVLHQRPTW